MMSTATGKLIKAQRESLGLLQKNVAKEAGVTAVFLGRVERGTSVLPAARAKCIAKALRLPIDDVTFALQHDHAKALDKKIRK